MADDWTRINGSEVARRAISRIEARGKGILLLHDIHARIVPALPEILNELKSRGYKIVHVVPAAADRPKTETSAEQWVATPRPSSLQVHRKRAHGAKDCLAAMGNSPSRNKSSIPGDGLIQPRRPLGHGFVQGASNVRDRCVRWKRPGES